MVVTIELSGIQRDICKTDRIDMPITGKTTVFDVFEYIRDKYPAIPLEKNSILFAVNDELATPDRLLKARDIVYILPHIGGG